MITETPAQAGPLPRRAGQSESQSLFAFTGGEAGPSPDAQPTAGYRPESGRTLGAAGIGAEELISLRQAATHPLLANAGRLPGQGPTPATLGRWCAAGHMTSDGRHVRLEHLVVNGRKMTSAAAIERFIHSINACSLAPLPEADRGRRNWARAAAELDAAGI